MTDQKNLESVESDDDEVSQVTSWAHLKRKTERIESTTKSIQRQLSILPKIQSTLSELSGLLGADEKRISRLEERHHDCAQVDNIAAIKAEILEDRKNHEDIVRVKEKIQNTEEDIDNFGKEIKDIKGNKARTLWGVISLIFTNVTIIVATAWFLSGMNFEVRSLRRDVDKQNSIVVDDLCQHMSNADKSHLKQYFTDKPIPLNCRMTE